MTTRTITDERGSRRYAHSTWKAVAPTTPSTIVSVAPPGIQVHSVCARVWSGDRWAATTAAAATRKDRRTEPQATRPTMGDGPWEGSSPEWSSGPSRQQTDADREVEEEAEERKQGDQKEGGLHRGAFRAERIL